MTLDYEKKQFLCKVPIRGRPNDFLTTNRRDADKVLDRQVRDQGHGHVTLLKDLILDLFYTLAGKVQVFIHLDLCSTAQPPSTPTAKGDAASTLHGSRAVE